MKKRVLYITRKYPPQIGGMENVSYNLYTNLKRNKEIDIDLVCLSKKQVHLIWFFPYACLYVLFHARKYDVIFMGDSLLGMLGVLSHIVSPKTKRCVNVHGLDITFKNAIYQFYLKLFYKRSSDLYICVSKGTEQLLRQKGSFPSIVIPNGVNVPESETALDSRKVFRAKYQIKENELTLITVGRLVKRKGVQWFIENVLRNWPNDVIRYFVIGDGPERAGIEDAIAKAGLQNRVTLLGKVPQQVLDEFYQNADIFVMPNISVPGDMEGFGIVAVEASISGLLVIASGIEGICDAIVDGRNGILLEAGNAEAYIKRLGEVIATWPEYDQLRKEYAVYTREHYSWEKICNSYVEVLKSL